METPMSKIAKLLLGAVGTLFCTMFFANLFATAKEIKPIDLPLFGSNQPLVYYHAPKASLRELNAVNSLNVVFEIDLAWAHSKFKPQIKENAPYIGHPEEFYTKMGKPFPEDNVSLVEFIGFLKSHPGVRVLLDLKDKSVFPYVKTFVHEVGKDRFKITNSTPSLLGNY